MRDLDFIDDLLPEGIKPDKDIVVNMDGGVGGSWKEVEVTKEDWEDFWHNEDK